MGSDVGILDGSPVGSCEGFDVVGNSVGILVVGENVGTDVGLLVGSIVGSVVGSLVGSIVGF